MVILIEYKFKYFRQHGGYKGILKVNIMMVIFRLFNYVPGTKNNFLRPYKKKTNYYYEIVYRYEKLECKLIVIVNTN